jgi:hypothetical protein
MRPKILLPGVIQGTPLPPPPTFDPREDNVMSV